MEDEDWEDCKLLELDYLVLGGLIGMVSFWVDVVFIDLGEEENGKVK